MSIHDVNRRRLTRYIVDAHVGIADALTGDHMGSLVDIHQEGLMLMADKTVLPNTIYQMVLSPVGEAEMVGEFQLGADCLWVREMAHGDRVWAGCRIIDLSDQASGQIQTLIDLFSHSNDG